MKEKEFYKKYIQSEDEKMLEIIHENARKHKNDKSIEKNKKLKIWLICVIVGAILFAIGLLVGGLWI